MGQARRPAASRLVPARAVCRAAVFIGATALLKRRQAMSMQRPTRRDALPAGRPLHRGPRTRRFAAFAATVLALVCTGAGAAAATPDHVAQSAPLDPVPTTLPPATLPSLTDRLPTLPPATLPPAPTVDELIPDGTDLPGVTLPPVLGEVVAGAQSPPSGAGATGAPSPGAVAPGAAGSTTGTGPVSIRPSAGETTGDRTSGPPDPAPAPARRGVELLVDTAGAVAGPFAFPLGLVGMVAAFLVGQSWLQRGERRLDEAPLDRFDETAGFS